MAMAPSPVPCHTPCTGGEENCVPDAHIYEEVIRLANINPDETLFIDDLKKTVRLPRNWASIPFRT